MDKQTGISGDSAVRPEKLADRLRFGDVQWGGTGNVLIWHENRSDRGVLVAIEPFNPGARDITRFQAPRAGVGYGGGDFGCGNGRIFFVSGHELFAQSLDETAPLLLYESEGEMSAPACSPEGDRIVFIESWKERERLAVIPSGGGPPLDLHTASDFNMQPCWHPSGRFLAWVTWNHPHMPWERGCVRIAGVSDDNSIHEISCLEEEEDSSVFQPVFSPDGNYLAFVSDRDGWANLRIHSFPSLELAAEVKEQSEHCVPAWIQGLRTIAWTPDSRGIYVIRNSGGFSSLARYDLEKSRLEAIRGEIEQFLALSQPAVSTEGRIALIGSSPSVPPMVLVTGEDGKVERVRKSIPGDFPNCPGKNPVPLTWISSGENEEAQSGAGKTECHGLFYPADIEELNPEGEDRAKPGPAVIRIHGGPTSCCTAEFDPDVQFYTTRGFSVLALNYRGSSGYGREFRSRLDEQWGVTDVVDVKDAADYLIEKGLADKDRLLLDGGSAGGFTLLLSLMTHPGFFRGGVCRYGVADLLMLTRDTHRFESHYLDSLIGPLPEFKGRYIERSPISHLGRLSDPVAIFQGTDDKVVPLNQAEVIVSSLVERGIPHLFRVFEGEGHGWKKKETIKSYFETVEAFLLKYS